MMYSLAGQFRKSCSIIPIITFILILQQSDLKSARIIIFLLFFIGDISMGDNGVAGGVIVLLMNKLHSIQQSDAPDSEKLDLIIKMAFRQSIFIVVLHLTCAICEPIISTQGWFFVMMGLNLFFAAIAGIHIWRNKHPNERWKLRVLLDLPGMCLAIYSFAVAAVDLMYQWKVYPVAPGIIVVLASIILSALYMVDMYIAKSKSNYKKKVGNSDLTDALPVAQDE